MTDDKKIGGPPRKRPPRARQNVAHNTTGRVASQSSATTRGGKSPSCWCDAPTTAWVEGRVLGGLAVLAVPVCDKHIPQDHAQAERIIAATLIAIGDAVNHANTDVSGRGRKRVDRP